MSSPSWGGPFPFHFVFQLLGFAEIADQWLVLKRLSEALWSLSLSVRAFQVPRLLTGGEAGHFKSAEPIEAVLSEFSLATIVGFFVA